MRLTENLLAAFALLMTYCFPVVFIFFLVFTLAMKERDTKLKIREIMQNIFKKMF